MAVTHSFNLNYYEDGTLVETETLYRDENTHTSDREVNGVFYYNWDGSATPNLFTNTLDITSQTVVYIDDMADMVPIDEYYSQEMGSVITYTISDIVIPLNYVSKLSNGTDTYILKDSNAANKDLSNITSTGKSTSNGWFMPDYSSGVSVANNTEATATENCFITQQVIGNVQSILYINGVQFINNSNNASATVGWFVPKGATYKTSGSGTYVKYPLIGG
jgi:hypothetical protein